jgi:hypothetical protein
MNLEQLAAAKGFSVGQLTQFGIRNGQGGVLIPYRDPQGNEYIRSRVLRDPDPPKNKDGRYWSKGDAPVIPYGLERPVPCKRGLMWIVEGESDCWTLWLNGVPAIGIPGVQQFAKLALEHLEGVKEVAVVEEPDEAGQRFPYQIANHLYDAGFSGKVFAVPLSAKDPRELWVQRNGEFLGALRADYRLKRRFIPPPSTAAVGTSSVSFEEVFDLPIEDVSWLVDGLIPQGGVTLLSAKPKVGKSLFARNLALAVARGDRFLGRHCEGGLVLWAGLEERKEDIINAFKRLGAQRKDAIRMHFGAAPVDALAWLQRECEAFKPALIVLDTWHKLTLIENVNDYGAVNRANEPLMRLSRERGVAQVWIHHNNKSVAGNGDEVLGSSALFAAADVLITMTRGNDGTRACRSIQRVGIDLEETVLEMHPDTGRLVSSGSRYTAQLEAAKPQILIALGSEALTRPEILEAVEGRNGIILAALNDLLREGLVVKGEGTGKRGDPIRYRSQQNSYDRGDQIGEKGSSRIPGIVKEPPEPQLGNLKGGSQESGTTMEPSGPREPTESWEDETDAEVQAIFDHAGELGL